MTQPNEQSLSDAEVGRRIDDPLAELRTRARRGQILAAASEAFANEGFHRTKVRDIAARAGLAEGTIYNYFRSKEDLLVGLLDLVNETDERPAAFAKAEDETLDDFVREYVGHRLQALEPHLDVLRPILSELLVDVDLRKRYYEGTIGPTLELAEAYFANKMSRNEMASFDSGLLARAVAAQVFGLAVLRMLGDERLEHDWDRMPDLLSDLLLGGLVDGGS